MHLSPQRAWIIIVVTAGFLLVLALACKTYGPSLTARTPGMPSGLYFLWRQTLYDPILALPGSEPGLITEAVSALRMGEATTLEAYTDEEQQSMTSALHPYDFLLTLEDLESARRTFIDKPSYWHALRYHIALIRTLAHLRDYTRMFSDTIYDIDANYEISASGGITSRLYVAKTLAQSYIRAKEQQMEVHRRVRCLVMGADTQRCSIRYPKSEAKAIFNEPIDRQGVLGYADALRSYFFSVSSPRILHIVGVPSESLPLVYVRNSSCTIGNSSAYLFFWRASRVSGVTSFFTTPTDEIYFHHTEERVSLFEAALADAGVSYAYQQMNPYLCFDYTKDAGTVRTAYAVYLALSNKPIAAAYQNSTDADILAELAEYERVILADGDIIDTGAVDAYMQVAGKLLYNQASLSELSEPDQRYLLSLLTLWRAKSAWLETEIATMEDMSGTNRYVFRLMGIPLPALLFTRSYYSTLLLSGNETLYAEPLVFIESHTNTLPDDSGLVPYQGVLEQSIPLTELPAFMLQEGQKSMSVYTFD